MYIQYMYQLRATLGKSVISGSQRWKESTCNDSVAYSVFQFDYYYVTWEKCSSIVCSVRWNTINRVR
jgi:hypothetical protein